MANKAVGYSIVAGPSSDPAPTPIGAVSRPQPAPKPGDKDVLPWVLARLVKWSPPGHDTLIHSLVDRAVAGEKKYGTRLQTNNGRDAVVDAFQEAQDAVMYLSQRVLELGATDKLLVTQRLSNESIHLVELLHLAEDLAVGLAYFIDKREKTSGRSA